MNPTKRSLHNDSKGLGIRSIAPATKVPPRTERALTLIELLLVIVIVGLLAALMLSALATANGRAKRIQCLSNQKQLAMIWMMYAADNTDMLVQNGSPNPDFSGHRRDQGSQLKLWVQGAFVFPEARTNSQNLLDPKYALFADYLKDGRLYVCPADRPYVEAYGQLYPKLRSYALNAYLGWVGEWDVRLSLDYKVSSKLTQIIEPVPTFLFQDVQPDSICFPYLGVRMQDESFFNFPGTSHGCRANISFADGRVEGHRWFDPRTLAAISRDYHLHTEPSVGNPDLEWLRRHTTVKK